MITLITRGLMGSGQDRLWSAYKMLEMAAQEFNNACGLFQRLQAVNTTWNSRPDAHPSLIIDEPTANAMLLAIKKFKESLAVLGTTLTLRSCERLEKYIEDNKTIPFGVFNAQCNDINLRFTDELEDIKLYVLEKNRVYLFKGDNLFGRDFAAKFPTDGVFELDEAGKCLALGRSTATVFHLMRLMEIGIEALRLCLGIPDPIKPSDRNWGNILKKIRDDGIERKWPKPANRMQGDAVILEDLFASLDAVKNPWRNSTMHVEKKYTEDEADHIFIAVKGFMKNLASRMDENGMPLA